MPEHQNNRQAEAKETGHDFFILASQVKSTLTKSIANSPNCKMTNVSRLTNTHPPYSSISNIHLESIIKIEKMRKYGEIVVAFFLISIISIGSCNKEEQAREPQETISQKKKAEKEAHLKEVKKFLDEKKVLIEENKKDIAEFRERVNESSQQRIEYYKNKIDELEQKNEDLLLKMNEFKEIRKKKWQKFKNEVRDDFNEISAAIQELNDFDNKNKEEIQDETKESEQ